MVLWSILCEQGISGDQKATRHAIFFNEVKLLLRSIGHNMKIIFPAQTKASQIHTILYACKQFIPE